MVLLKIYAAIWSFIMCFCTAIFIVCKIIGDWITNADTVVQ